MSTGVARSASRYRSTQSAATAAALALDRGRYRFLIAPFFLGLLAAQTVNVAGELYLGEVLGILLLLVPIGPRHLSPTERRLVLFAILWSAAQALSDVYNQTALSDSLKGVLAPLVFMGTILGLAAYFRASGARIPSFLLGAALGTIVSLAFFPTEYSSLNAWKFGVGGAVLAAFAIHYSYFLRRKSVVWLSVALLAFLLVSLHYDSRSLAVLPLLAGLPYALVRSDKGERLADFFGGKWGPVRLLLVALVCAFLLSIGTTALFLSSPFQAAVSSAAAQKYAAQASGRYGVLLGGRSSVLVSAQAFLDKPLLGHGSWPRDTSGYRQAYAEKLYEFGYSPSTQELMTSPWIPTHSYLMGALVWSGIFGGLFWITLLYLVFKRFLETVSQLPFYFYIGTVALAWDVLFSPFGASNRWNTAVFLAAFLAYTHANRATAVER